jgi:hypothetical protein
MPSPPVPSARVLQNRANRVVMNRAALDAAQLGIADGLIAIGAQIVADYAANAPRDPETAAARGVPMMADQGKFVVYALGKKVGGDEGGTGKPRAMRTPKDQVVLGVWVASPLAHLVELGTVKMQARPTLLPSFDARLPGAAQLIPDNIAARIKAVPG